jgi:hypothetical protein
VYGWAPVRIDVEAGIPEGITTWIYPQSGNVLTHSGLMLLISFMNYVVFSGINEFSFI